IRHLLGMPWKPPRGRINSFVETFSARAENIPQQAVLIASELQVRAQRRLGEMKNQRIPLIFLYCLVRVYPASDEAWPLPWHGEPALEIIAVGARGWPRLLWEQKFGSMVRLVKRSKNSDVGVMESS